ncbi:hypothetical protein [Acinetobacter sp.]|uniref:hypothetical protein n=1 Tax=Acinetobacter sp. TaxID=472 RepID=UPI00388D4AC8
MPVTKIINGVNTQISSIGTNNRDYATVAAWEASIPSNPAGTATRYIGELYKDSEFLEKININNRTTTANYNVVLRTATGQSFRDHESAATNPLFPDPAYGVFFRHTPASAGEAAITVSAPYTEIEGIQVYSNNPVSSAGYFGNYSATNLKCSNSIILATARDRWHSPVYVNEDAEFHNVLVICNSTEGYRNAIVLPNGSKTYNCGFVRPSNLGRSGQGVSYGNGSTIMRNSYSFGFATTGDNFAGDHNATDCSRFSNDPATGDKLNLTMVDQFVQPDISLPNPNFRLKKGSALYKAGADLSSVGMPLVDMMNQPHGPTWDIGPVDLPEPATTIRFNAVAVLGLVNEVSGAFKVDADGEIVNPIIITPSDNNGGGLFNPTTVTISEAAPVASFTYTPSTLGDKSITLSNNGGINNPSAVTYKSATGSTKVTWGTYPATGRGGEEVGPIIVSTDGVVTEDTEVTPNDGDNGGYFVPSSAIITRAKPSVTFVYVGNSGGNKTFNVTNNKGLANPQSISLYLRKPITAQPTPSSDTLMVKSIGPGKDFATIRDFGVWVQSLTLSTLKMDVLGEVYVNDELSIYTQVFSDNDPGPYRVYLQPVPGLGFWNYEEEGDKFNYTNDGIQLTMSGPVLKFGKGLTVRGFMINIPSTGSPLRLSSRSGPSIIFEHNRFKIAKAGTVFETGEFYTSPEFRDNLFIREAGDGAIMDLNIYTVFERNTIIAIGTGTFTTGVINCDPNGITDRMLDSIIRDNAFINVGGYPIRRPDLIKSANIYNNATDNALATTTPGIAVGPAGSFLIASDDYRPKDKSLLVGGASSYAIDAIDNRYTMRGGLPDIGAVQGAKRTPLPLVTITNIDVNGQDITVYFDTKWAPFSGTALLKANATNPDGASTQSPVNVTLTEGKGEAKWVNVPGGNYEIPIISLKNDGGVNNSQTGGAKVKILNVIADIIDGESSSPTGGSPSMTLDTAYFDNDTLILGGKVDNQGDSNFQINVFVDPQPSGTPIAPQNVVNILGKTWGTMFPGLSGSFKVRMVIVANNKTVTVSSNVKKVISYNAVVPIELDN